MAAGTVLFLSHTVTLAGGEQSLLHLHRGLVARGWTTLLVAPTEGELTERFSSQGGEALTGEGGMIEYARRLGAVARERGVDVVHANGYPRLKRGAAVGYASGLPVVCHARNMVADATRSYRRPWIRPFARRIDRFIAISEAVREDLRANMGVRDERIRVVHNPVEADAFDVPRGAFRRELGIADDVVLVGQVGQIEPRKAQTDLVEAAAKLVGRYPKLRFVVVGEDVYDAWPEYKEELLTRIDRTGVRERMILTGERRDIPQVMRDLDVLVMPSLREPFGRVLIEAMAAETAVVATRVGGVPEIVDDRESGLLVPPADPRALATAIERLLVDADLRARLAARGARVARERFGLARHVEAVEAVYADLMDRS